MEEFKDINDYPGYKISNTGRVISCINNRYGIGDSYHELYPCTTKLGYKTVQLGRNNRKSIHRLVAEAFIPNPNNYPLVRHLDDNPSNNNVENLEWGTQTDNMRDCVKHNRLVGDTRAAINSKKKKILALSKDGKKSKEFSSIRDAARELGVWPQHICNVAKGKISQTGGWIFRYVNEEER